MNSESEGSSIPGSHEKNPLVEDALARFRAFYQKDSLLTPRYLPTESTASEGFGDSELDEADWNIKVGRYLKKEQIGEGGFGVVYRGFDDLLKRDVAIKQTRPDRSSRLDIKRLIAEAKRVARLQHDGIVRIYDTAATQSECMVVFEYLRGVTLDVWSAQQQHNWGVIANLVAQVADSLAHAHQEGIVHRDVKPANIMVRPDGRPVLLDLGLAISDYETERGKGYLLGTPDYMSPEQAKGQSHHSDGRTDIYSLGIVLYKLMTRRLPHRAANREDLREMIIENNPQPPRQIIANIPHELERICLKAMKRELDLRYGTASDLAEDLRNFMANSQAKNRGPAAVPVPRSAITPSEKIEIKPEPPVETAPETDRESKAEATSASQKVPQRRPITVLFCGFRLLLDRTVSDDDDFDYEEQQNRVETLFRICDMVIQEFSGTRLFADGRSLTICFGYPKSQEKAPQLAVSAGLQILQRYAQAFPTARLPRLSINSGMAFIGASQPGLPPTIQGDVIHDAERLALTTELGKLIITEATYRLVEGFFDCKPADGASRSFEVIAPLEVRNRIEAAAPGTLTPLIGRDREVDLLKERWEYVAEGIGHVTMLVADPGLGKSRLVAVLRESIQTASSSQLGSNVIEWFGSEQKTSSPLGPAIEYFNKSLGLQRVVDVNARLDTLLLSLKSRGFVDPTSQAVFCSFLSIHTDGRLPELNLTPEQLKQETFKVILEWLERESARDPLLFIVEDLHWFDPTSLELLTHFVDGSVIMSSKILGVFTTRPEFDPPWKGRDNLTRVSLTRLTPKQVHQMMAAQAGMQVPEEIVQQILQRTDGVPLFVEVFTRLLLDTDPNWLDPKRSNAIVGKAGIIAIPETLRGLLLVQLDRIGGNKEVVEIGAVIGRSFSEQLIGTVLEIPAVQLHAELEKLVSVGLLFLKGTPPNRLYTFKHALIQDAAYELLPKKTRQQFHKRIAEKLVQHFSEIAKDQPDLIAQHFTKASELKSAVQYWLLAGQRSRDRSANLEAIGQLSQGLELVKSMEPSDKQQRLELEFSSHLGATHLVTRGYASQEAETHITHAHNLALRIESDRRIFQVKMTIWSVRLVQGRIADGEILNNELLAIAEAENDDGMRAEAHWTACCNEYWAGRFAKSKYHAVQSIKAYQIDKSRGHSVLTGQNCGPLSRFYGSWAALALGDIETALSLSDSGLKLAATLDHPFTSSASIWHHGYLLQLAGKVDEAIQYAEKGMKDCAERKFNFFRGLSSALMGASLGMKGEHKDAISYLRDGLQQVESTGCDKVHQHYLTCLAQSSWALGHRTDAWDCVNRALAINDRDIERAFEAEIYRTRGIFLADEGESSAAEQSFLHAISVSINQQARFYQIRAATDLAEFMLRLGRDTEDALSALRLAVTGGNPKVESPEFNRALALLGQYPSGS